MAADNEDVMVTTDSLDASLDDLLKAADASDLKDKLSKAYGGVNVEHTGHVEPGRGNVGGGLPDGGDLGTIDNMMIGKMVAKLSEAGFSESQIRAFMSDGGEEEEEEDEEEDEEMVGGAGGSFVPNQRVGTAKKSGHAGVGETFRKSFMEDPDIAEAVDAAPFMEALTAKTTQALDTISRSLAKSEKGQTKMNRAMAGAMYQTGQLLKSQAHVINELAKRLNIVERTPMPPRGQTGNARALHKGMPGEAGRPVERLTKSEALGSLSYLNLVKGERFIAGEQTSHIIAKLESSGEISPEALGHVQKFLETNPNEADAAKQYA